MGNQYLSREGKKREWNYWYLLLASGLAFGFYRLVVFRH
jgi:hypothetical protein